MNFPSPDGEHTLCLEYEHEVAMGAAFYRAELDGRSLAPRFFGSLAAWSHDSVYLALQEWHSTSRAHGPDTSLFLIRLRDLHYTDRPRVRGGFVSSIRFEGSVVVYAKDMRAIGRVEEFELDPEAVQEWRRLFA